MTFLAKSKQGVFLVPGRNFKEAVGKMRDARVVEQDEVPQMITMFNPSGTDVEKSTFMLPAADSDTLASAIVKYREACVALSWIGSTDVESHAEIENEYIKALAEIEHILGKPLPKAVDYVPVSRIPGESDRDQGGES